MPFKLSDWVYLCVLVAGNGEVLWIATKGDWTGMMKMSAMLIIVFVSWRALRRKRAIANAEQEAMHNWTPLPTGPLSENEDKDA